MERSYILFGQITEEHYKEKIETVMNECHETECKLEAIRKSNAYINKVRERRPVGCAAVE